MSSDVMERFTRAMCPEMPPCEDCRENAPVAARVLLDYLGTFHGIPASELMQARRELGLDLSDTDSDADIP